jgi:hypothetical protein
MTEGSTPTSYSAGQSVQGIALSDEDKQAVNQVLRRNLANARGGDEADVRVSIGVLYVDPPGICIPL